MDAKKKYTDTNIVYPQPRSSLTTEQAYSLLITCKEKEPDLFLPLLIASTTGCRISELIALCFQSINIETGEVRIRTQLGRKLNDLNDLFRPDRTVGIGRQQISPKSYSGIRKTIVPDFVIEEIILAKKRYSMALAANPDFYDGGYIWFQANGMPHGRGDYSKPFNRLKKILDCLMLKNVL